MSAADAETLVELDAEFDLRATIGRTCVWGPDPTTRFVDDHVWMAFRTSEGPATVRYSRRGSRILAEAWGPGAAQAIAAAPDHLGVNDTTWRLQIDHPIVGPLVEGIRGLRFGKSARVMERLLAMIIGQKVTSLGASQSWRELIYRWGERAPGPRDKLWIPPSAERLRALAYYDLHTVGIERKRADTILFAARRAKRLETFAALDPVEAHTRLLAFPGIGPWTAGLVTSAVHGDTDALPVGDYHIPNHVAFALAGEPRADDARMLELLEPFRPHRGRVLAAILSGGPPPPRYGPRLSVRDIRDS